MKMSSLNVNDSMLLTVVAGLPSVAQHPKAV